MAQSAELDEPKVGEQTTQDRIRGACPVPFQSRGVGGIRLDRSAGLGVGITDRSWVGTTGARPSSRACWLPDTATPATVATLARIGCKV